MSLCKFLSLFVQNWLIISVRSGIGAIFICLLIKHSAKQKLLEKIIQIPQNSWHTIAVHTIRRDLLTHIIRNSFIVAATFFTYKTYRNLPLTIASALGMMGPMFTFVLSWIFLKEKITWQKFCCLLSGYLGVLMIIQPDWFNFDSTNKVSHYTQSIPLLLFLPPFLANFFAACSIILTKKMLKTNSPNIMILCGNIIMFSVSVFMLIYNRIDLALVEYKDIMILLAIAFLALVSQKCSMHAFKYANPAFLAPFEYLRLCFMIIISAIFFNDIPSAMQLAGSVTIIFSVYLLSNQKTNSLV
jgi:S-adenosylmethionine uptake transporter